ncbi:HTH domain-containing protein [Ruthenibacterium lactatiformans]|uniref:HTH domain-containing protein n=1 Tax=Ruthenibacterium lactatiformans TaxID=1550024 RepID=UPI0039A1B29F
MGANERRRAILELLCQRKQDTMRNLANEFHVSLRTICYDIDELTRNYPIVTIRGKYKGGVKIADGYLLDQKYLNLEQRQLLKRLSKTLSGKDRNIMESILRDFTLKEASEADPGC